MNSTPKQLSQQQQRWHLVRWTCVLPAAAIGAMVAHLMSGVVSQIFANGWGIPPEYGFVYGLRFVMYYLPRKVGFVLCGALMAPRFRVATAFVLAAIAVVTSLLVHVLGQRTVGVANYTHLAAESVGALCGVLCAALIAHCKRRSDELPGAEDAQLPGG